jgi:hypothetical protein
MPNLARVIPVMDHIEEMLSTRSLDMSNDPAIRTALTIARKTAESLVCDEFERSYNHTNETDIKIIDSNTEGSTETVNTPKVCVHLSLVVMFNLKEGI